MQQPALTVLMPVYNGEKYLIEAIESILNQTLKNFEFLIIDDASTDKSVDIIKEFNDKRIRLMCNDKNLGIAATLNKGIELAKTELIARMDADDISHETRLQKQFDYFAAHPDCALLSCTVQTITHDKQFVKIDHYKSQYYYYNLIFECWIYHPTVMYKKSAVQNVGGYQSTYSEDFDLWWHLSRNFQINHLQEVLLDYRLTNESLCRVTKKTEYEEAQLQQFLRNIHYYTGSSSTLSINEIDCLRHNFEPILNEQNNNVLIQLLQKLDYINGCIFEKEKHNDIIEHIKEAAFYKKKYILDQLTMHLAKTDKLWVLLRSGNFNSWYLNKLQKAKKKHFEKPFIHS